MIVRRITATVVFAAAVFGALGASVAQAEPIDPVNGPGRGCPIVNTDSNGNETVTYAKPGDRNGVLVCGSDGEWSFGRKAGIGNGQAQAPNGGVAQR
ncbi:hypothetical protein [Rhodococcoides yunnanense]|uniref:hypothetical protein n=1 Tax=Rhodococcoides yunnanense TaxID=278209 RepID=UPI0009353A34|nr:hypothetical protein [Rhodococcus yunnanensis]